MKYRSLFLTLLILMSALLLSCGDKNAPSEIDTARRMDGYRGIWHADMESEDEYRYIYYSGGLGTYTAKHRPNAIYSEEAGKTFFCYGGVSEDGERLVQMVSYFDHRRGTVPKPVALLDKDTGDAHDNPSILLDNDGFIWIFASAHGRARYAYIYKSREPYSIDSFEEVSKTNFSYPQPWYIEGRGFLFLHTLYIDGRQLYWSTSPDGVSWSDSRKLSTIDEGHYQVSWKHDSTVGTAFNFHPSSDRAGNWDNPENPGENPALSGANNRTNLYYIETDDFGETWRTAAGEILQTPLTSPDSPALVHDYFSEGLLVYLKDIAFDEAGNPLILFLTSLGSESGPQHDPRTWRTAYWDGVKWKLSEITTSDNNYDAGSISVDGDGLWTVIAPTGTGPQPYNCGGEVELWLSADKGMSWERSRAVTSGSEYNHSYVKKVVNAQDDFFAFWADGHGRHKSESRLYFAGKNGDVFKLPENMTEESAKPEPVFK